MLNKSSLLAGGGGSSATYRLTVDRSPSYPDTIFGFCSKESSIAKTYGGLQPRTFRTGGKELTIVRFGATYNPTSSPISWEFLMESKEEVEGAVRVEYKDVVLEGAFSYNGLYKGYYAIFNYLGDGTGYPAVKKMHEYFKAATGQTINITLAGAKGGLG